MSTYTSIELQRHEHREQLSRNQKESHRRDAENAEVPSPGAHASSAPWVSNTQHAGCVRSQENAEENPWQLAKDFRFRSTDERGSVHITSHGRDARATPMPECKFDPISEPCAHQEDLRDDGGLVAPAALAQLEQL